MEIDYLISPSVPNKDYEGAMVFLDIVVDKELYALVKLLPHVCGMLLERQRERQLARR